MNADYREILNLLQTEIDICRDWLEATERERPVMLRSELDALEPLAVEKEALVQRMQAVERQREQCVQRLAGQLGCQAAELTLRRLVQTAPPAFAKTLASCRIELSGLLERLRTESRRNAMLSRHTAELLRSFYGVLKGLAANGPVYRPGGRMQSARLNGKLLSHAM